MRRYSLDDVTIISRYENRPNILAWLRGKDDTPTMLFNGHTDAKPPDPLEAWKVDPYSGEIIDGEMYGRGAADMKSGIAAMLMAMVLLRELEIKLRGNCLLALTADEEATGQAGLMWLVDQGRIPVTAGLIAEPSGRECSFDEIHLAQRGNLLFDIKVHGTPMHSSVSDIRGAVNASLKLSKLLLKMSQELRFEYKSHPYYPQGPTLSLGDFLKGGVFYAMLPENCVAGNDLRILPGMKIRAVEEAILNFLEKAKAEDPQLEVEYIRIDGSEGAEVSPDEPIVKAVMRACAKVLGRTPVAAGSPGSGDASYVINTKRVPIISDFGPGQLSMAHAPNERVPVQDIVDATKIYALTAADYLGEA